MSLQRSTLQVMIQDHALLSIVVIVMHALGVLAAIHAAFNARTAQGAVAWVVALVSLPYLTLVLYLFFGPQHISGYVVMTARRKVRDHASLSRTQTKGDAAHGVEVLAALGGNKFTRGNRVRLLINGLATFEAMFAAIHDAQHYIFVQTYLIRDDALGIRLQQALIAKARAGCRVYVLFDGIGSQQLSNQFVTTLRAAGVAVHPFAAASGWRQRFRLNFRNHRKVVVADGVVALLGGHNIGDEYRDGSPTLGPWRDTHIEICGPAVAQVAQCFIEDWAWVSGTRLPWTPPAAPIGTMNVAVVGTGPVPGRDHCGLLFVQLINLATRRVWISSPYFVPDESVQSALKLAQMRGVDVRVLIPSRPDHLLVYAASSLHAHEAVVAGIRVFRYTAGFLHQKVVLIDEELSAVGTANLDNRSFRLNFEITALIADLSFAREIQAMLENDFRHASAVREFDYLSASRLKQVGMHAARLFAPIL